MALALVVSTLFCLSLAVLNVKAGANRKSIHSLVLKLMIAFVADLQTYTTYLTTTLLHYVNLGGGSDSSSTPSGVRIQDLYDLGFLQCLSKSDTFAERYRDGMLFFNAVPLLSGLFVTFIAASVVGLSIPLHANSIRKRRRLYEMLIQKNLIDAAAKLGREIDNTRTLSVWRYTTARPIPVAAHVIRFFRDMVPPYIVIGVTYYNILLRRQTDLLACTRDAEGVLRNASVTGIKCAWDDSNYVVYFSFGLVFMFFWGLGLPVVFLCLLLPHSNQLNSPQILQKYGFLHNGYDLRYWYWEIFFFARKAAINISLIISHNDSNYMKFALFISLMFFTIHVWISPFDRRNNNIMSWLDIGCLACWIVSLTLACFGEALDTEGSNVIGLVIIFINVIFALFLCWALWKELCNWARTAKPAYLRMAVVGSVIRMMASFSQSQKQREPRVIFNSVRNEVMLGATEKGSKGKIVVKLYPNGIPRPPVRYSQEYFVSCLNDTFVYFLQQRGNGIINGEMCMYIVRMALVTASMDLQAKQEAVQLSEIPEKDFTKFVDNLKREQFEKQKEEMLRLQKLQRELDAYFSGRDMTARQEQVPEEKQVINTPGGVSLPALFEASTLKQTLPLPDFYALLYQLRQSKEDPGHFDRYRVIKFIHDRQRLEAVTEKWNELSTLNTALAAARDNDSISIEPQAIQQLNVDIDKFKAHLQLLEKTLEYSIFRSLDFATILMAVEDTGNDPLDRRIEPLTQNRYQLTEPTSPMSFGSSASEMNLSPEDLR